MTLRWLRRIRRSISGPGHDRHITDELRLHVEMETEELVRQGLAPAEARRRALVALGGADRFRDEARDTRSMPWLNAIGRDVRHTLRGLRAAPGFSFVVILTLALGIGANTTFFSILNSLVLRPLPVHEPERLVQIPGGDWTYPIWEQVRDRQSHFAEAAFAWAWSWGGFDLGNGGVKQSVDGAYVSGDMFRVLGVPAFRGRVLTPDDDSRAIGGNLVAVISHRFWQQRFDGSDSAVGSTLSINRTPVTIVGVAPPSFFGLEVGRSFDVMVPFAIKPRLDASPRALDARSNWWVSIGARIAPGQSIDQAQAALRAIQPAIREATIPGDFPPQMAAEFLSTPFDLAPLATGTSALRSSYQPALQAIMAVVALVLLIACANVANLLLARARARQREFSVRLALGASRARLAAQLMVESVMLASLGALGGLLIAVWASALVVAQLTTWRDAVFLDLSPDWRVFGFMVLVTLVTAVVFGLAPVWNTRTSSPQEVLRQGGRGTIGDRRFGTRNVLVVAQLALSLVLLVGAGLFLRTFVALDRAPTGMRTEELLAVDLDLSQSIAPPELRLAVAQRMLQAATAIPGVESAAATRITPLSGQGWNTGVGEAFPPPRENMTWMNGISPDWFDTVGALVREGRTFNETDGDGVVIVNESFARRFLKPGPAAGQTFILADPGGGTTVRVVGLTTDVLYRNPREGMRPTVFVPLAGERLPSSLLLRAAPGQKAQVARAAPAILGDIDPMARFTVRQLDDLAGANVSRERLTAGLAVAFGGLALMLAAIGLYGVMSYSVGRRRAEIAMRMALGADRATILRLVVGNGAALVLTGVAAGVIASWWAARYVQSLLFDLDARDAVTMGGAALVLAAVGLLAAWLPARRAAQIDPAHLLREN